MAFSHGTCGWLAGLVKSLEGLWIDTLPVRKITADSRVTSFYARLNAEVVNDEILKITEPPPQADLGPSKSASLKSNISGTFVGDSSQRNKHTFAGPTEMVKATPRKKAPVARQQLRPTPKRLSRPKKFLQTFRTAGDPSTPQPAVPAAPRKFSFSSTLSMGQKPQSLLRQAAARVLHMSAAEIWASSSVQAPLASLPEPPPPPRLNKHAYREAQERRTKKKHDCRMPPKKRVCHDPVGRVRPLLLVLCAALTKLYKKLCRTRPHCNSRHTLNNSVLRRPRLSTMPTPQAKMFTADWRHARNYLNDRGHRRT